MQLSVTHKLHLSFVTLTALVLVATLGLARWSFERGFLDYTNTLARGRLQAVAADLVAGYEAAGDGWAWLDAQAFERIVDYHDPPDFVPPRPLSEGSDAGSPALPPDRTAPARGPITALFDADGRPLAGPALDTDSDGLVRLAVLTTGGSRVGELRSSFRRRVSSPADTDFARQQGRRSLLIGGVALAFAALASWGLSRALLAPIRASMATVARLSSGDFSRRPEAPAGARDGDELVRLANDLERLRHTLESGRGARRRLFADVSHELRTPLTILSGEIAAMRDGVRPVDAAHLTSLAEETHRLERLVDDLHELALSDIGGLRYEHRSVRLDACLDEAVEALRPRAERAGIELSIASDVPVGMRGDARRLHQLFANLLDNALAYTDAPGRIAVALAVDGGEAHVTLDDTAPGVAEASHAHLFESLYRAEGSRNRRSGGSGLGLAICRNIVAAHGGRIHASASPLGGLRIDVHLPIEAADSNARRPDTGRGGRNQDRAAGARLPAT